MLGGEALGQNLLKRSDQLQSENRETGSRSAG